MLIPRATGVLLGIMLTLLLACSAQANEDKNIAYIAASDAVFDNLAGMRAYFKDAGVPVVHVAPEQMAQLADAPRYLVFGSPDEQNPLGDLIRAQLSDREKQDAAAMGKGVLAAKTVNGKEVLFFVTAYSMPAFVKGHATEWKDIFEDWYCIAQSITSIIGY